MGHPSVVARPYGVLVAPLTESTVTGATAAIWRAIRQDGLSESRWGWTELPDGCHYLPEVRRLSIAVSVLLDEQVAIPQLILRLPEEPTDRNLEQYEAHVDEPLARLVVGVVLSPTHEVVIEERSIPLTRGDLVWWHGDIEHAGVPNTTHEPRLVAYWRWT